MAEEQARRPKAIKYGDVFEMSGELGDKPISPRDAAAMRSAENTAFGKTLKGGPASLMQSAASKNLEAGLVAPDYASGVVPAHQLDAEGKLSDDKLVEIRDAEWVAVAELGQVEEGEVTGEPNRSTTPGGVAETVAMAAMLNQH